jgi:excisionase family DNA binding protein
MNKSPNVMREGLSISEACEISGVGRTKLYEFMKTRRLPAKKIGSRTIILRADLFKFLASLPTAA